MFQVLIEFDQILRLGLQEHFESTQKHEPLNYSKDNVAQFICEADKILEAIEREIRKIISAK